MAIFELLKLFEGFQEVNYYWIFLLNLWVVIGQKIEQFGFSSSFPPKLIFCGLSPAFPIIKYPSLALASLSTEIYSSTNLETQPFPINDHETIAMGRGKPTIAAETAKKPKTAIQLKREERRAKKALPRPEIVIVYGGEKWAEGEIFINPNWNVIIL